MHAGGANWQPVLNNELVLNNVSCQSPKECFPVALFYESDSRDNLEENVLKPRNAINEFISSTPNITCFLAADEMFTQACLDGSGKLDPKSKEGWNIYSKTDVAQKKIVAATGLRTDLPIKFDRDYPENIFPGIDLSNIVFCSVHATARIVEKLLFLEVEGLLEEKGKSQQKDDKYVDSSDLIRNLENNINKRGVRNGNFRIHFDEKTGKPSQISLNKDAALSIISPSPPGFGQRFPHVLQNVLRNRKMVLRLPESVHRFLDIPAQLYEFELVSRMWQSMHYMLALILTEPGNTSERLKDGADTESQDPSDYVWGYTAQQIAEYKFHAERFYHLFCARFSPDRLTPYMMKLIDYGRYFLENLPFPINRFQAEGSEHLNYEHNKFYYGHTTRHGGVKPVEPLKALFLYTWRRLSYDIKFVSKDPDTAQAFQEFVEHHTAAVTIQKFVRAWLVRRKLKASNFYPDPQNVSERLDNYQLISEMLATRNVAKTLPIKRPFHGLSFVMVGNVPKTNGKKMTQKSLQDSITQLGGRVKSCIPGDIKGVSTKKYIVLFENTGKTFVPIQIRRALSKSYHVVCYKYIFDAIDMKALPDLSKYHVDLPHVKSRLTKALALGDKHFRHERKMISIIRNAKKTKFRSSNKKLKLPTKMNIAQFYAHQKRNLILKTKKTGKHECRQLLGRFMVEWKSLKSHEKRLVREQYALYCQNREQALIKLKEKTRSASYINVLKKLRSGWEQ